MKMLPGTEMNCSFAKESSTQTAFLLEKTDHTNMKNKSKCLTQLTIQTLID